MQTIIITGGAGFIGINTAKHFLKLGYRIVIIDDLSRPGSRHNLTTLSHKRNLEFVKADITKLPNSIDAIFKDANAIIHLAAQVAVTTSVADPMTDFMTNAYGTLSLLEKVRRIKPMPFIFASTNKVYGNLDQMSIKERAARYDWTDKKAINEYALLDFHSPYGCSKGAADQYVRDYARIYHIPTVVFRQSCIYGPHQYGVEDQGWLAWFVIANLLEKPITIYGTGKQVRDLLFVTDLIQAYQLAIENISSIAGKVYNIGGGPSNSLSLIESLELLKAQHLSPVVQSAQWRPGDQKIYISDNTAFSSLTNWHPTTSPAQGIPLMTDWISENLSTIAPQHNT